MIVRAVNHDNGILIEEFDIEHIYGNRALHPIFTTRNHAFQHSNRRWNRSSRLLTARAQPHQKRCGTRLLHQRELIASENNKHTVASVVSMRRLNCKILQEAVILCVISKIKNIPDLGSCHTSLAFITVRSRMKSGAPTGRLACSS